MQDSFITILHFFLSIHPTIFISHNAMRSQASRTGHYPGLLGLNQFAHWRFSCWGFRAWQWFLKLSVSKISYGDNESSQGYTGFPLTLVLLYCFTLSFPPKKSKSVSNTWPSNFRFIALIHPFVDWDMLQWRGSWVSEVQNTLIHDKVSIHEGAHSLRNKNSIRSIMKSIYIHIHMHIC